MGTDTTPDLAALRSDMQDVLYGAIYHNRYDTSAEAMDALLPIVERYAAAKTANELEAGETRTEWGAKWADGGYCPSTPATSEEYARKHARTFGTRPIRREVGPWVYADTGEHVFPWVPVEDEAAELAGRDGDTTHG